MPAYITQERRHLHDQALNRLIRHRSKGGPNFADSSSHASKAIADRMLKKLGAPAVRSQLKGQEAGRIFEELIAKFLQNCFRRARSVRPGNWTFHRGLEIAKFAQYAHLEDLSQAAKADHTGVLQTVLGDYTVRPDIVISRSPEPDSAINSSVTLVDNRSVLRSSLRARNSTTPILHASISCKYTIRSDRSQNSRTEALNLIRNRKGHTPHITAVTVEPMPSRLGSLALGTGDIDCVYHFALDELIASVAEVGDETANELLAILVDGKRLRDISDLPLDLAV